MPNEEDVLDGLDSSQMTEETVAKDCEAPGKKPSASVVQKLLDKIASIEDGERRALLFVTARQHLTRNFHTMVTEAQKKAAKYWTEQRARQKHEDEANPFEFTDEEKAVEALNKKCAIVWWNGGYRYVFWDADGFPVFGFRSDAEDYYAKYQLVTYDSKGFPKYTSAFDLWRKSHHRREYDGVGFYPDASKARARFLNLWTGFAINPAKKDDKGDWSLLRAHVLEIICQGNKDHYEYLMDWMSQTVFEPMQKSGVIVVLRGVPGTGKTKLGEWLMKIIGWKHSVELTQEQHLTGNFNAHIEMMLFILAEEAFFAADPKAGKVLKTIATSTNAVYEYKGKDIRRGISCCRVMMPTNSTWAVPVEARDRRYYVLDVSDKHANDKSYFAAIDDQMENGGAAAFLRDLLARKMTFRNMKEVPMTDAKREQIRYSMSPKEKWLASVLTDGQFPAKVEKLMDTPTDWPAKGGPVAKSMVLSSYQGFVSGHRGTPTQEEVALFLKKYFGTIATSKITINCVRVPHYVLPALTEARAAFLKATPNYDFDTEVEAASGKPDGEETVVPIRKPGKH